MTVKRETVSRFFRDQPTVECDRLILRRIARTDAADMYAYARDARVTRYLTWDPHPSLSYTEEYLAYLETRTAIGDFFDWAVIERATGRMVGTCGFTRFRYEDDCGEIGYVLSPDVWGKGYAVEALRALLDLGFGTLGLARIEARIIEGNAQSFRVAEKLGMRFEGYLRNGMRIKGVLRTIGICSILREEATARCGD